MKTIFKEEKEFGVGNFSYTREVDSDYTGRWMIQDDDLFIECFDIEEYDKDCMKLLYRKDHVYNSWWDRINATPSGYEERADGTLRWTEKRVRANVRWVHEDKVRIVYQYINECSGVNG
jgi:hypothetical protein